MAKVQLPGYRCERCGHEWVPRDKSQEPRVCPHCKSPYWDKPRRSEATEPAPAPKRPARKGHAKGKS